MDLADLWADWAFRMREAIPWSAPVFERGVRSIDAFVSGLSDEAGTRARTLAAKYDLSHWKHRLSPHELRECLYVLDLLDVHLGPPTTVRALDVGSRSGFTLPALVSVVPTRWDLVELDAHRRYLDLSTRAARGKKFAQRHPGCRYWAQSVTTLSGPYDVVTWFLPYVIEGPLRAWGLPRRMFEPERLFHHVIRVLAPGGVLFVLNQGERERDAQRALFEKESLSVTDLGRVDSPLSPFSRPRYGFRFVKSPTE